MILRPQLDEWLDKRRREIESSSCTLYLRDPKWPAQYRLAIATGLRFVEPMYGFVFTDTSIDLLIAGPEELFSNISSDSPAPAPSPFITDEVPQQNRTLFGDFRERENVKAFARLAKTDEEGNRDAVFFVNFDHEVTFDEERKLGMRTLFSELATRLVALQDELTSADVEWRSEATRIVSPIQTIASINFYTFENPDAFFGKVIESALSVLNIPEGTGLGVIHLYNAELNLLELHGAYGPIRYPRKAQSHEVNKGDGVISWVALTRRALVIQDLQNSEFKKIHVWLNRQTKSELVVPLEAGGELIGTICLESTEVNRFKPHHARSLWYAANKAALAFQMHQLASMSQKLLKLCWQATAVEGGAKVSLRDVAALAKEYLKASSCDIWQYNPDSATFDRSDTSEEPEEPIPQVRSNGWTNFIRCHKEPIWVGEISGRNEYSILKWDGNRWVPEESDDAPTDLNWPSVETGVRSALGLPITVRDNCIGVAWIRYRRARLEGPKAALMSLALGFAAEAGLVLDSIARREVDFKERGEVDSAGDQIATLIRERWDSNDSDLIEADVISRPFHWKLGGDYYAIKKIDKNATGILLLDGQGHGVAGSLHMLPLMTTFELSHDSYSTAHVISELGKAARALGVRASAIYSIFMKLDDRSWLLTTAAGHEGLIHFKKEERDRWTIHHVPPSQATMLGHPLAEPLFDHRTELSRGDVIVGYTDGVAEQLTPFDANRVTAIVSNLLHDQITKPKEIAEAIMEAARKERPRTLPDDATVFVVRVR